MLVQQSLFDNPAATEQDPRGRVSFSEKLKYPIIFSDGMGLDSWAAMIGWHRHGLPVPAAVLHAETGSEKPQTYAMIPVKRAWLARVGWPDLTLVKNASPIAGDNSLHEECLRKAVLPSLAYGGHSCSIKWKVEPQKRWVRETFGWHQPRRKPGAAQRPEGAFRHGPFVTKVVGYDAGPKDARRVNNSTEKWPEGHLNLYPLIEWGWDRRRCVDVILSEGLAGWDPTYLADDLVTFTRFVWIESGGLPCKSACFMCPASQIAEIVQLKSNDPELLAIALDIERTATPKLKEGSSVRGLGRNKRWDEVIARII